MTKLLWKFRFARKMRKLTGMDWPTAWEQAVIWIAYDGMELDPEDAVEEELSCWTD